VSDMRRVSLGYPGCPRGGEALHAGEVADGGARIRVWATRSRYGITVAHAVQTIGSLPDTESESPTEVYEDVRVHGGVTVSIGGGLSLQQAEALITELTLAVRAKRLADGEPWHGREVAPGVLRAPQTEER
jgi:hypothetical protein